MSSYTPAVPSANGGTNAVSQDTFAAGGAAVSGSGGGGGGVPANAIFSTVTIVENGHIYFSTPTTPTYGGGVPGLTASIYLANAITEQYGEAVACTTNIDTVKGTTLNPFAAGMYTVATNLTNTNLVSGAMGNKTGDPGNIDIWTYDNIGHFSGAGRINLFGFTSVSSLTVSSINGQIPGTGGGPAVPNAQFSSITMAPNTGYISTSFITPTGNGSGGPSITLPTAPSLSDTSFSIAFNSAGHDTVVTGQLTVGKNVWLDENTSTVRGLGVQCYSSILGSFQPFCCGDLYVNNSDGDGQGTGVLKYIDSISTLSLAAAGPGGVSISSLSVSSISGINFAALVSTVNGLAGGGGGGGVAPSVPSAPTISGVPGQLSMTLNFDSAGMTGTAPITYSGLYGLVDPPTTPASMVNIGGTSYVMPLSGLVPNTPYFVRSVATNATASVQSLTAGPFTTAP